MTIKTEFNIDVNEYLINKKYAIDNCLKELLKNENLTYPKSLWEAIKYSLLNGGKRIRGILCLSAYESISGKDSNYYYNDCLVTACSIEMVHAMSLIHDDLPSMDNDDLRRGKPSCHKAFGEATAILAGDAMLSFAFQIIIEKTQKISEVQKLELINTLTNAFSFGLVPGQIHDLDFSGEKNKKCTLEEVQNIAKLKTAELIKASVLCGAIIALDKENKKDKEKIIKHLSHFGEKIGLAYQIIDDILDITSDTKTLGKTSGKDEKQKKATFPSAIGVEKSKKMAKELIQEAKFELESAEIKNSFLSLLSDYIINRIN